MFSMNCDAADKKEKSDKKTEKSDKKEKETKKDTKIKAGKPQYGEIVFPRKGSIDFDEGTYEIWFKPTYTTSESMFGADTKRSTIVFMSAEVDEKFKRKNSGKDKSASEQVVFSNLKLTMGHHAAGPGQLNFWSNLFDARKNKEKGSQVQAAHELRNPDFQKDRWYYLAITWKHSGEEYECGIYIDDTYRKFKNVTACSDDKRVVDEMFLVIGSAEDCNMAVDSFRVSNRVRTDEEITKSFESGLSQDDATLIFHNGESFAKMKKVSERTDPLKCSPKGEILGASKMVDGKFGKAILLNVLAE